MKQPFPDDVCCCTLHDNRGTEYSELLLPKLPCDEQTDMRSRPVAAVDDPAVVVVFEPSVFDAQLFVCPRCCWCCSIDQFNDGGWPVHGVPTPVSVELRDIDGAPNFEMQLMQRSILFVPTDLRKTDFGR